MPISVKVSVGRSQRDLAVAAMERLVRALRRRGRELRWQRCDWDVGASWYLRERTDALLLGRWRVLVWFREELGWMLPDMHALWLPITVGDPDVFEDVIVAFDPVAAAGARVEVQEGYAPSRWPALRARLGRDVPMLAAPSPPPGQYELAPSPASPAPSPCADQPEGPGGLVEF